MQSILSTSNPKYLSAEMLSRYLFSNAHFLALLFPTYNTPPLPLLNLMPLLIFQSSNVFRSLCKAFCSFRESTALPSLVSSTDLLRMHSTLPSRSWIKMLKRTGTQIEPWEIPLVTACQPGVAPFTMTLWALLFSQSITQHSTNLFNSHLDLLSRRMPVLNALLKSKMPC